MGTHTKGYKYILSASISPEIGSIMEERNQLHGINKSFDVEQALRQYYGLDDLKNGDGPKGSTPTAQAPPLSPTSTPTSTHAGTLEVDRSLRHMGATTEGSRRIIGGIVDANGK